MRNALACVVMFAACGSPSGAPADEPDAGSGDDAPVVVDAPPGAWTAAPDCSATVDAVFAASGAGPRGSIAACALGELLTTADAQTKIGATATATTGVQVVKLAYRTVRSDGTAAITVATAYLPLAPRGAPAPVILIGHPTTGIADSCAPSKEDMPQADFALPFAARGFVTIAPDYAGLGNAGTHAYLDTHEEVTQLFDGVAALRALEPNGAVGDPVAAVGYSQGGGVVLGAQALEMQLTGKHTLKAVAAFAPEWPISTKSFGYEDILRNPDQITALAGLSAPEVFVLRHYGYFANHGGDASVAFPTAQASSIAGSIEGLCTVPLGGALDGQQRFLRDLVDDTFRAQILGCIDHTTACAGAGHDFYDWLYRDFVTADAHGARVLIAQGLADQVMPAAGEAACDVAKLRTDGVQPDLCVNTTATHESIVGATVANVVPWVEAVIAGTSPPACGATALPACNR